MVKLSNRSWVPIGWVFVLLSCSGSALLLAVKLGFRQGGTEARVQNLEEYKTKLETMDAHILSVDKRLSWIEGRLGKPINREGIDENHSSGPLFVPSQRSENVSRSQGIGPKQGPDG